MKRTTSVMALLLLGLPLMTAAGAGIDPNQQAFYAFAEKANGLYGGRLLKKEELSQLIRHLNSSAPIPSRIATVLCQLEREPYSIRVNQLAVQTLEEECHRASQKRDSTLYTALARFHQRLTIHAEALQQFTDAYTY